MAGKETKQVQDFTNFKNYYQHLCNLLGPATNTGATEMTDMGPILKEREKKKSENVGKAEKKASVLCWGPGKYECVQGCGQERSLWEGNQKSKENKKSDILSFCSLQKRCQIYSSVLSFPKTPMS